MNDLKMQIKSDVIELIENPEEYKRHGLSLPNGILLYGPPGCGKTFFAEKFAEEVGFNFYQIKPSDIQSKWVNASQENVKQLFDEAAKQAPSIIFIDEVDALLPNRENNNISHMNTSVVNEFLAQLNSQHLKTTISDFSKFLRSDIVVFKGSSDKVRGCPHPTITSL